MLSPRRKEGKICLCVDLREPTKSLIVDSHPLPHMDELLRELRGTSLFTTIDLVAAYHHEECWDITAFLRMMVSSDTAGFRMALLSRHLPFKR